MSSVNRKLIKVEFSGDVIAKINDVTFMDENGKTLVDNVDFTLNKSKREELTDDVESIESDNNDVNLEVEQIPQVPFYIQINGKDVNGNHYLFLGENPYMLRLQEMTSLDYRISMQTMLFTHCQL